MFRFFLFSVYQLLPYLFVPALVDKRSFTGKSRYSFTESIGALAPRTIIFTFEEKFSMLCWLASCLTYYNHHDVLV